MHRMKSIPTRTFISITRFTLCQYHNCCHTVGSQGYKASTANVKDFRGKFRLALPAKKLLSLSRIACSVNLLSSMVCGL